MVKKFKMKDHSDPLKAKGYTVITVGVGLDQLVRPRGDRRRGKLQKKRTFKKKRIAMVKELKEIASKYENGTAMMYLAEKFDELVPMMAEIAEKTCTVGKS